MFFAHNTRKSLVTLALLLVVTLSTIAAPVAEAVNTQSGPPKIVKDLHCGMGTYFLGGKNSDIISCFDELAYYAYVAGFWAMSMGGSIFDASFAISISHKVMDQQFVRTAWGIVRDIANLGFIFVLIYIAIATILRISDYKRPLMILIVVALVINFSFFISRAVIDAGNIIALSLYSAIQTPQVASAKTTVSTGVPEQSISAVIVSGMNPQAIAGTGAINALPASDDMGRKIAILVIYGFSAIIMFIGMYAFIKVAILLIARVVMLWFAIIGSPLAFIAMAIPGVSFMRKWWQTLFTQTMLAPVFLFFVYVIVTIIESKFLTSVFTPPSASATPTSLPAFLVGASLPFVTLLIALLFAVKLTTSLSGQVGDKLVGFASKAVSWGVGTGAAIATGGASIAGRQALGRAARAMNDSDRMKQWASRGGVGGTLGRGAERATNRLANSTYDFRNIPGVQQTAKTAGVNIGKGSKQTYSKTLDAQTKGYVDQANRVSTRADGTPITTRGDAMYDEKGEPMLDEKGNQRYKTITTREAYARSMMDERVPFSPLSVSQRPAKKRRLAAIQLSKKETTQEKLVKQFAKEAEKLNAENTPPPTAGGGEETTT